ERDTGGRIAPHAAVVGTAVLEHGRHGAENAQRTLFAQTARVVVSRDATHISRWPPLRPQLAHPLCYEALCPGASYLAWRPGRCRMRPAAMPPATDAARTATAT